MCEQHHRTPPNGTCWKFYPESVPMNRGNYGATMRAIDYWRKSDRGKALMQRARDRGEYDRPDYWNGPELGAFAVAAPEPEPEPQPTLTPAPGHLPPSNWISLIDPFDIEQRATALQGQPETVSDLTLLNQTDPYEPPVCPDDIIWDTGCQRPSFNNLKWFIDIDEGAFKGSMRGVGGITDVKAVGTVQFKTKNCRNPRGPPTV